MSYIIIIGILIFLFFIWWANRPLYHRNVKSNEFERYLKGFLDQMRPGSLMFIHHESSDRFVQYAKYESEDLKSILNCGFPDAPWSRPYFDNVAAMLQENHINYHIVKTEGIVNQFIVVDIVSDNTDYAAKSAAGLANKIFKVMGLDEDAHYRINSEGTLCADAAIPELEKLKSNPIKIVRYLASRSLRKRQNKERKK